MSKTPISCNSSWLWSAVTSYCEVPAVPRSMRQPTKPPYTVVETHAAAVEFGEGLTKPSILSKASSNIGHRIHLFLRNVAVKIRGEAFALPLLSCQFTIRAQLLPFFSVFLGLEFASGFQPLVDGVLCAESAGNSRCQAQRAESDGKCVKHDRLSYAHLFQRHGCG